MNKLQLATDDDDTNYT